MGKPVNVAVAGNAAVVMVTGEVDTATAHLLAEGVHRALLLRPEPRAVIADLSGVSFLAAAGATALLASDQACERRGVPLWVVAPHRAARCVLEICGLTSALHVVAVSPLESAAGLARALEDRAVVDSAVGVLMAADHVDEHGARAMLVDQARDADVAVRNRALDVVTRSAARTGSPAVRSNLTIDLVAAAWETEPREHQDHITDLAAALKRQGHQVALHVRRTSHEPPASERTASGFDVVRVPAGPPTV
ncbi:anti-sigma factor antagonist, partial [Umezawaea endophytica]